ncbi:MAG: hypothetical protein IT427_14565, partial [Pirellulales bacterium]|nr:hypothetical protein [Pirellulales bacterium]
MQEGTSRLKPKNGEPLTGHFSAIWVRRDKAWKLASLTESRIDAPPSPADRLAMLEPFIGSWSGKSDKISLQINSKWNAGKTYMLRDFVATSEGREIFHGKQVVGWDPKIHEIRSWTFNEDGGYAESLWSLEGNVWMVASKGTQPSGKTTSMTQIYKFVGKDKLNWKLKTVSGDSPETILEVELTRSR